MQKHSMINKVTLLLAFVIIGASNLFAQMVLQTDKDKIVG
jgi:hypothetical protein